MKTVDADVSRAALDRLVDGELDEPSRAAILRTLDRTPDGWKRCAVAFLEAQAWRDAMPAVAVPVPLAVRPSSPLAAARRLVAVAAAVAVAFCAGFVSRGKDGAAPVAHQGQRVPAAAPGGALPPSPVPDYLRTRMERQGYRVEGGRRMVELALDDGRTVAVPVDTVSYRYVGQRIH